MTFEPVASGASDPLAPLLRDQGCVVLDGGLATELERRGADLSGRLWSARVLRDAPDAIRRLHEDYLLAGADCIVAASYQATPQGLEAAGLSRREAEGVLGRSVRLAIEARSAFLAGPGAGGRPTPLVAASVGPYGAYLADGSEYRGDYGLGVDELVEFHRHRLAVLSAAGPDLLAIETVPSFPEAVALRRLLDETTGPPAWMSFSCRDGISLWDGSPLAEVVAEVEECSRLLAVGVNCTAPRWVGDLLERVRPVTAKPLVAYPNSGEGWDAASRSWLPTHDAVPLAERGRSWLDAGAGLIGGCCRTGPEDIAALRRVLLGPGPA